ncbi:Na(+)/H(+) antiporter subunit D [Amphiplicatus metriothermophilus]|uniref:Multisubunit sodium/proton antiporter, MrpD subunit n=1 Tax=Amphiplicatus metriothermophilus TaxID=1519374 RepID=A0A239PZ82_9PROT|nr:Na(+)/H(+) antiporter subunit D [Amphiplicatus metriothermophilus]MBB5518257.1 multicomponent Na+:H+ antiporter subunit D [Amphiplicatus metriothermophilus]SNT75480.1 multisubunit sodium/proton antiporter, MrpD subunit [Amphiplicatus metriothermophilus]
MGEFSPALIVLLGGLLAPLVRGGLLRNVFMLALPALAGAQLFAFGLGEYGNYELFGHTLTLTRIDGLSRMFATVFLIAIALNVVYAWHVRDRLQQSAALIYPGSALGAVLAGDLVTLFVFWELAAITSVFLIWASRNRRAFYAGMRYLVWQIASGVLLLAGVVFYYRATGSLEFGHFLDSGLSLTHPALLCIFLAFGIKSAFPLLHNWVQDSYPESTVTGTIVLSIFTTKMAVASLARGFAGVEALVYIGAAMTAFPIFFAVIENDLRRVLTYSLNNQVGFMVVGVGVGTPLALNGAASYAFCNILFEGLLFMAMGAVLYRTGTIKGSELGGLYKTMPWTTFFCLIGAASISAFPLFSGFVTKGLIISGAAKEHYFWVWLTLLFAAAGVFHHSGIKIPYFAFFAHDSGKRPKEAPLHMLIAMGVSAALCVGIGVAQLFTGPAGDPLYALMPFEVKIEDAHSPYIAYTAPHILVQLQILFFSGLAFAVLQKTGLYPPELKSTNLDSDWFYRVPGRALLSWTAGATRALWRLSWRLFTGRVERAMERIYAVHGPEGRLARTWPVGSMALWTAVVLGAALALAFIA